jgi:tripartite-type tricarboxylate transporter receptor subunit TctC
MIEEALMLRATYLRRWCTGLIGLLIACGTASTGVAQNYPNQPLRWIVTTGPGGAFNAIARGLAPSLSRHLDVNVVVENIPGPDGYNRIYSAKPDGYTIGIGDPVGEFGQAVLSPVPYRLKEMTWIGRVNAASNLAVASKKSGVTTFEQLKASTNPVRVATFGVNAPLIQMIILAEATGLKITTVNFRAPSDVIFGVVRGDADVGHLGMQLWTKHIEAGNVAPLFVWDASRDPRMPNVPSLRDLGHPVLASMMTQRSIIAPPNVPADIQRILIAALQKTVSEGDGLAFLNRANFENNPLWGAEYQKLVVEIESTVEKHKDVLKKFTTQ